MPLFSFSGKTRAWRQEPGCRGREGKFSPSVHVKAVIFMIKAEEEVMQQAIQRDARQQGRKKQGPLLAAGLCGP